MFKQFEIQDENKRIIAGWASVMIRDLQNDIVPVSELEKAMYNFMDRGGHIIFSHQNKPVGKVLRWEIKEHTEKGKLGLWIVAKIFNDYPIDDKVWEMIKSGVLKGFSIGGAGKPKKKLIKENGTTKEINVIEDVQLMEISIVEEPANPFAKIEYVNYFAKGSVSDTEYVEIIEGRDDGWYAIDKNGNEKLITKSIEELTEYLRKQRVAEIKDKFIEKGMEVDEVDIEIALDVTRYCDICKSFIDDHMKEISIIIFGDKPENLNEVQRYMLRQIEEKLREIVAITMVMERRDRNYRPGDYDVKIEKKSYDGRYMEEDRRFKEMTCPDDSDTKNRFCGCVRYFMNVKGLSLDNAKRMCSYIKRYVKKSDGLSLNEVYDMFAEYAKELEKQYLELRKPFAGFKNFDDCLKKVKEQGYDDDSAHRICGKLYWEHEGKDKSMKKNNNKVDKSKKESVEKESVDIPEDIVKAINAAWESYINVMGLREKVNDLVKELETREARRRKRKWLEERGR